MKKNNIRGLFISSSLLAILIFIVLFLPSTVQALTPGAILYRTTSDGKMFGYSKDPLLEIENGILMGINPGHAGIYIGKENGEDYVIEALAGGIVKTPAKYFVNESLGEELVAVKIPNQASKLDRLKAITIAKNLVGANFGYDLGFQKQKGPGDGDWTCVGLTEKIYESAGISNPGDINSLVYDPEQYKIDITPDGFDNREIVNDEGDCVSKNKEFSKIARREDLTLPLPEVIGYNAGREYRGERYFFLPYTQMIQPSLRDEKVDINLVSSFDAKSIRGKTPVLEVLLRWSLINNPVSTLKNVVSKAKAVANKISDYLFGKEKVNELVLSANIEKAAINKDDFREAEEDVSEPVIKINTASKISTGSNNNVDYQAGDLDTATVKREVQSEVQSIENVNTEPVSEAVKIAVAGSGPVSDIKTQVPPTLKTAVTKITSSAVSSTTAKTASTLAKVDYSPNSGLLSKISSGVKPSSNNKVTSTDNNTTPQEQLPARAFISKIYATDNNDFIELYNPLDYDFDLAEEGFRLEKAKTAEDPSLMVRIGDAADGYYPKGTIIKAKSFYLIVRDDAAKYYLDMADAVVTKKEFSWTGNGYTIYLGKGAISSSADIDIVDAVGFGEAKYFQGAAPASAISDNYFLERVSSKNDNSLDFKLQVIGDPSIVWDDASNNQPGGNQNNNQDNNQDNNQENNQNNNQDNENSNNEDIPEDFVAFSEPTPIDSNGLTDIWHFDSCYGEEQYAVGRFGCALELRHSYATVKPVLSQLLDLNKMTLSFYYRDPSGSAGNARFNLKLKNANGQQVWLVLEQGLFQIEGLPNSAWRYWGSPVLLDSEWHNFSLVVNKEEGYWAAYFDGIEKYRQAFVETLPSNFNELEIYGDMYSVFVDELSFWDRALSPVEISANWQSAAPFSPIASRSKQQPAALQYFWDFNEGHEFVNEGGGNKAVDKIKGLELLIPENSWVWRGTNNSALLNSWSKDISVDLKEALDNKDMSIAFWWRSRFYPQEGRSLVALQSNNGNKLALVPDQYRRGFYFNNAYGIFSEGQDVDLPFDENWHHFALTYDSYRYQLKMYVDGEEKRSLPFYWLKDGEHPDKLLIKNELNSVELDDLGIWEGSLTPLQVKQIFTSSRVEP